MNKTHYPSTLYYIILLNSAALLVLAFVVIPLFISPKIAYFTAPAAGIGGLLMLQYFAKSYQLQPVMTMLLPFALLTVVALVYVNEYTPQMIGIIWLNILVGSTAIKFLIHFYERVKKKKAISLSLTNATTQLNRKTVETAGNYR
jgi:hypothetical protein